MVVTRQFEAGSGLGSGAGSKNRPALTEDRVREIIREEVLDIVRGQIPEMLGSITTAMMEYFDDRYTTITETVAVTASTIEAAAGVGADRPFQ